MAFTKWRSLFLVALMVGMLALPMASAADSDGDGIDDSVDDCPYSYGDSKTLIEADVRTEMGMELQT